MVTNEKVTSLYLIKGFFMPLLVALLKFSFETRRHKSNLLLRYMYPCETPSIVSMYVNYTTFENMTKRSTFS